MGAMLDYATERIPVLQRQLAVLASEVARLEAELDDAIDAVDKLSDD